MIDSCRTCARERTSLVLIGDANLQEIENPSPWRIQKEITEGLQAKGCKVLPFSNETERSLEVEVRFIQISHSAGFWTGGLHAKSAVKAIGRNGGETYEQFYRFEEEKRIVFVPGEKKNEEILNRCISEVLKKIFQDEELISLLAK